MLPSSVFVRKCAKETALKFCSNFSSSRGITTSAGKSDDDALDPFQESLLKEECILVNENDQELGSASKRICHLKDDRTHKAPLHRAFSLFIFNNENQLLMQQRSDTKVTFPGLWTNTCCSHPLFTNQERLTKNGIGAKHAAQRKVFQELGIKGEQCEIENIQYLTRILYSADSDGKWAENELDYILFLKSHLKQLDVEPNPEEVQNIMYLNKADLSHFIKDQGANRFTPWFLLMSQSMLPKWWDNIGDLKAFIDEENIIKY